MIETDTVEISVSVDVGTISDVEWTSTGDAVTITPDETDSTKAIVRAVKSGEAAISAEVTVSDGEQTATDTVSANIKVMPSSVELDLSTWNSAGFPVKTNDDGSIEIEFDNGNYRGTGIEIPEKYSGFGYAEVSVTSYREDGTEMDAGNQIVFQDRNRQDLSVTYGKGVKKIMSPKSIGYLMINAQDSATQKQIMKINYVKLVKTVTFDLKDFNPGKATEKVVNEDGSVTLTFGDAAYTGSAFNVPEGYEACKYFEVKAISLDKENPDPEKKKGVQVSFKDESGADIGAAQYIVWSGDVGKIEVPEDKNLRQIIVNNQDPNVTLQIYHVMGRY